MVKLPGSDKYGKNTKKNGKESAKTSFAGKKAGATGKNAKNPVPAAKQKTALPQVGAEWLYVADHEVTVEEIAASFEDKKTCEIWLDEEIAEVVLTEKASMDMERAEADFDDEAGAAFLTAHGITEVYFVTIVPEEFELTRAAMEKIIAHCGGFFCEDNEEFLPEVRA